MENFTYALVFVLFIQCESRDVQLAPAEPELRATGCYFPISGGLPEPQPLFIVPNTNRFVEPQSSDGLIRLQNGQSVELFCSGSFVAPFVGIRRLIATCGSNNHFIIDGKEAVIRNVRCNAQVAHVARRTGRLCGFGRQTLIEVGFPVDNRFLKIMEICHDEVQESTLYSYYQQSFFNVGLQTNFPRPSFISGDFFKQRNINKLYTKATQKTTITRVLGSTASSLFDDSRDIYLARGHLAAKADFIYGSQQRGSFYYVNAAPQWQRFNAGNWESVESGVRHFVAERHLRVDIYTGTFGVLSFPDANGRQTPLFLDYDAQGNGLIPVPALFYKVIIDLATRRGVVLVGVNNPHTTIQQVVSNYQICTNVSNRIGWLRLNWDDVLRGVIYACDVTEFAARVRHLPAARMRTSGLLL